MFSLTIVFGPGPMVWTLMFKEEEGATDCVTAIKTLRKLKETRDPDIDLIDDFGQHANIEINAIHGFMLEDMEQSKLAHIERALHAMRVKVKGDEMSRADPVLRAAAMQGGTGILQPSMPMAPNGGWRG